MQYTAQGRTTGWSTGGKANFSQTCLSLSATKAGCPIQAVLWLEWDSTALDGQLSRATDPQVHDHLHPEQSAIEVRGIPLKPKSGLNGAPSLRCGLRPNNLPLQATTL
jgi:hypothetical protein